MNYAGLIAHLYFVLEFNLRVFDQFSDLISVTLNWRSGSLLNNYVAQGQCLCLLAHALISTSLILWKLRQNDNCYRSLWGTYVRRIITIIICTLGFGGLLLNVDIHINHHQDFFLKKQLKNSAELLHIILESLPQSIVQTALFFYHQQL